jgi:hypothetical protein
MATSKDRQSSGNARRKGSNPRAWKKSGELIPDRRSKGGVRYHDVGKIMGLGNEDMPTA